MTHSNSSRNLINEYPLIVLPSLATKIGLNESIILQQVHYWLSHPRAHIRDKKRWIYNTYEQWQTQFPFLSRSSIIRTFKKLEKMKFLKTEKFNGDALNHCKWYTINYEILDQKMAENIRFAQNDHIDETEENSDLVNLTTSSGQFDYIYIEAETTTETTKKKNTKKDFARPARAVAPAPSEFLEFENDLIDDEGNLDSGSVLPAYVCSQMLAGTHKQLSETEAFPEVKRAKVSRKGQREKEGYSLEFLEWYKLYPKKVAKDKARKAFDKAIKRASLEQLMYAVEQFAQKVNGKDQEYIKHPATWLNDGCWMDAGCDLSEKTDKVTSTNQAPLSALKNSLKIEIEKEPDPQLKKFKHILLELVGVYPFKHCAAKGNFHFDGQILSFHSEDSSVNSQIQNRLSMDISKAASHVFPGFRTFRVSHVPMNRTSGEDTFTPQETFIPVAAMGKILGDCVTDFMRPNGA